MTEKIIVKDLVKQDAGSALVYLYEFEYAKDTFAYFADGLDSSLSEVTMLDYSNNSQTNTYAAIPVMFQGIDRTGANKLPNPTITVANVLSVFKLAVGSVNFEDLSGFRVIRRTTLRKYLKSEGDTNSPPIEYPRDVYYIDSLKARTKAGLEFSLKAPFDLEGIKLPARSTVPNRCPWIYQGASDHTENEEWKKAISGCSWHIESKYNANYNPTVGAQNVEYTVYVNEDDEYLIPSTVSTQLYSSLSGGTAIAKGDYLRTTSTTDRFNLDGTISEGVTVNNFWQARSANTATNLGTPSDTNINYSRIRTYTTYSHGTTYFAYSDDRHNDYVTFTDNTAPVGAFTHQKTLLWKVKKVNKNIAPSHSDFWTRGDLCSKTLEGCGRRFGFNPKSASSASSTGHDDFSTAVVIPFGGFPGAKAFN
tara:strand:+ start:1528 stop:2790 length:1263 start_codon:yes stop_codon:yes gene_type:complete